MVGEQAGHPASSVQADALAAAAAASTGELLTTVLFYPVELVKSRIQATSRSAGGEYAYAGLVDGLQSVLREEGLLGLFTGLQPVVLRSLSSDFATVYFGELLLGWYRCCQGREGGVIAVPLRTLGGWVSIALTLPLETVATRVTCTRPPVTMGTAVQVLFREGGLAAFWSGLPASLLLCLNPALMLTTVDWLRRLLFIVLHSRSNGNGRQMSWSEAFLVGATAKLLTMFTIYPLIRGKVLLQARNTGGISILQVLHQVIKHEGPLSLYTGLGAQLSKSLSSASLKYAVKERMERQWQRMLRGG